MDIGVMGLWMGITVALVYCSAWGTYLCISADWQKEVRKALGRLAFDSKNQAEEDGSSQF
jgi:MATE family multidrug resistance protein